MKRQEMIALINKTISNTGNNNLGEAVLNTIEEAGMLPPTVLKDWTLFDIPVSTHINEWEKEDSK